MGMPNSDFPYAEQNEEAAKEQAAAWNLTDVLLPSGGIMSVEYEADDYAYVQDKRASLMQKIAGFGKSPSSVPSPKLYSFSLIERHLLKENDHRFVFFDLPAPLSSTEEIATYYLQDFKQLLMKLWVKMPRGHRGMQTVFEPIMVYAAIKSYGFALSSTGEKNYSRFYVEMEPTDGGGSPAVQTAFQFLREKLPHRAFPGYQVNGDGPIKEVVRAVWGMFNSLLEGVSKLEFNFKLDGFCEVVDLDKSGARLNHAEFKKKRVGDIE
ncbi:MAG: hypothetical protein NVV59_08940 [Chitinophagaceae bacterium]|nr:hypothetical protein [Chitinophagaceae bacterium]